MFPGSIVKPGFNPLAAQTSTTFYNLFSWGRNDHGELGLNNTTNYSNPNQVGALSWLRTASSYHTLAISSNGALWAFGQNSNYGQLGLGNLTNYSSPKQVGALTNWSSISNGTYCSLSIKTDGTLWSWGQNTQGQLGLGNTTAYSSPKQIGALTTWSKVSARGGRHVLAVKTDGTLWSWGINSNGELGLGNTTYYSSPKQIGAGTTWASVSAGSFGSSFAIKTDGSLWSWGRNDGGELGLGNTTNYSSPKQVGALTNWSSISGSGRTSLAIKTDGSLWSWSLNGSGQLGLGNTTAYSSPKQVGSLTNWLAISAGKYMGSAIKTDGTLWTWGRNDFGQLGLGNTVNRSSPNQVGSSTTWLFLSSSYSIIATG
jgi:alpha-tubulin suppressor-like RCC1 family protein